MNKNIDHIAAVKATALALGNGIADFSALIENMKRTAVVAIVSGHDLEQVITIARDGIAEGFAAKAGKRAVMDSKLASNISTAMHVIRKLGQNFDKLTASQKASYKAGKLKSYKALEIACPKAPPANDTGKNNPPANDTGKDTAKDTGKGKGKNNPPADSVFARAMGELTAWLATAPEMTEAEMKAFVAFNEAATTYAATLVPEKPTKAKRQKAA